jgi:hypothetical protein
MEPTEVLISDLEPSKTQECTHASQPIYGNRVQDPQEQFVSHQDCAEQIAQDEGSHMVFGIGETTARRSNYTRQVEQNDESEQLPICVVPELKQDPSTNLDLWFRRRRL